MSRISDIANCIEYTRATLRLVEVALHEGGSSVDTGDVKMMLRLVDDYLDRVSNDAYALDEDEAEEVQQ